MPEARIDKWMWAVRIFKTRTIAAEACKKGRVTINGSQVKAARMIKPNDVIQVKKPPIIYSFKVLQAIEKRVGAKLVPEVMENVTTPDQYELLEMSKVSGFVDRARGTGRPTKKDRRSLEDFTDPEFMDDFDFDFDFEELHHRKQIVAHNCEHGHTDIKYPLDSIGFINEPNRIKGIFFYTNYVLQMSLHSVNQLLIFFFRKVYFAGIHLKSASIIGSVNIFRSQMKMQVR